MSCSEETQTQRQERAAKRAYKSIYTDDAQMKHELGGTGNYISWVACHWLQMIASFTNVCVITSPRPRVWRGLLLCRLSPLHFKFRYLLSQQIISGAHEPAQRQFLNCTATALAAAHLSTWFSTLLLHFGTTFGTELWYSTLLLHCTAAALAAAYLSTWYNTLLLHCSTVLEVRGTFLSVMVTMPSKHG
jgi:hypothetical protein